MVAYRELKDEYISLYKSCSLSSNQLTRVEIDAICKKIIMNKARYEAVAAKTNLWWVVIAIIHNMESSLSFAGHLHNGDPLTARTRQVPAGRPLKGAPPFTWEESALDAISMIASEVRPQIELVDTPEEILWYCENYNGWGYRTGAGRATTPPHRSPYLWSGTNHYQRGKYVADGRFSPDAISAQIGAATILKRLEQLGAVTFGKPSAPLNPPQVPPKDRPILVEGDTGDWVLYAQHLLEGAGISPKGKDGEFGPDTKTATIQFQSAKQLEADGEIGPITWAALEAAPKSPGFIAWPVKSTVPPPFSAPNKILADFAKREAGKGLVLRGPEDEVWKKYIKPVLPEMIRLKHIGTAYQFVNWCSCFVTYCIRSTILPDFPIHPVSRKGTPYGATVALVEAVEYYAKEMGCYRPRTAKPQPGWIAFFDWDEDTFEDHIGIILGETSEGYITAEGNRGNLSIVGTRRKSLVSGFADFSSLVKQK